MNANPAHSAADKMIGFQSSAIVRELPRHEILGRGLPLRWWGEFQRDLTCHSAIAGRFVIPDGFLTDGASVPRPVWALLDASDPDLLYPAFAHDYLYTLQGDLYTRALTRQQCDAVLAEQMEAVGAPRWKIATVYRALRLAGGFAWAKKEKLGIVL
jgi:hypothetical protein